MSGVSNPVILNYPGLVYPRSGHYVFHHCWSAILGAFDRLPVDRDPQKRLILGKYDEHVQRFQKSSWSLCSAPQVMSTQCRCTVFGHLEVQLHPQLPQHQQLLQTSMKDCWNWSESQGIYPCTYWPCSLEGFLFGGQSCCLVCRTPRFLISLTCSFIAELCTCLLKSNQSYYSLLTINIT